MYRTDGMDHMTEQEMMGAKQTIGIIFVLCAVSIIFGFVWMECLKKCASTIIKAMLYGNLVLWLIATIMFFASKQMGMGIVCLILFVIFALVIYFVRKRIPLASTLLEIGSKIAQQNKSTVFLQIIILVLQVIWILWWGALTYAYSTKKDAKGGIIFLLVVGFYWTLQVFHNIAHVTTCAVAAVWYFNKGEFNNPTWKAFLYAITKSLGSICFGSLLIAFVQTLRAIVRSISMKRSSMIMCLCDCCVTCVDALLQWFNTYVFAQVAIYGSAYLTSAKNTWSLLQSKGLDMWLNDDLTGFALACGATVGALVTGIVGYSLSMAFHNIKQDMRWGYGLIGFIIGFFLCLTVLQAVRSAVVSIFICWAEDPRQMQENHPEEAVHLTEAWAKVYGKN